MRKRVSRPPRFAAIDNRAIDTISSILATGLLTHLIRAKDGDDVTVERLAAQYDEGEASLTKAMRKLVDGGYVVKFKIQRAASETIEEEDGTKIVKRGGSWYTTFTVDSIPFTAEDVAAMLAGIYEEGNVRAVRVEPAHLDPRKDDQAETPPQTPTRPTPQNAGVGPTCGNADGDRPPNNRGSVDRPPEDRPSVRAGLYKEETVVEDSLSGAGEEPAAREERESSAARKDNDRPVPQQRAGEERDEQLGQAAAFAASLPGQVGPDDAADLAPLVVAAVVQGWTLPALRAWLTARCDLSRVSYPAAIYRKHLKNPPPPQPAPAERAPGASRAALIAACSSCDEYGQIQMPDGRVANCKHQDVPALA